MNNSEFILGSGRDYRDYEMTEKEIVIGWGLGSLGALVVFFAFHVRLIIAVPGCVFSGFYGIRVFKDFLVKRDEKILLTQFVSLIDGLNNSYQSGCNSLEAFQLSRDDLVTQYGENSLIASEMDRILESFENNIPLDVALEDFSERSGIEDIESFVGAFKICTRYGGDFSDVLNEVDEIIKNKVETDMEIATTISDKKMELMIMMIMPLLIVLALRGAGVFEEQSITTAVVKLIAMSLFAFAYRIGKGIIDIKV